MYKAIIIDDEDMARALLQGMLNEYCPQVTVIDQCRDLPSGVKSIYKNKPDIVFLDIEMPGHSGLELLDFFNEEEINFSIIFVTAYNKYAIQAFKLSATDYILKPFDAEDLIAAVGLAEKRSSKNSFNVLQNNLKQGSSKKIAINTVNSNKFIELSNILFIKAEGAYSIITLKDGSALTVSKGLKHFEDLLSDYSNFMRCHKSFVVNTDYITEYVKSDGGYLLIDNSHKVSITAEKAAELSDLIDFLK